PIIEGIKSTYTDIIFVGMGGASLNPQSLIKLFGARNNNIKAHFIDNTDPLYLESVLQETSVDKTAIIVASNSGNTIETISITNALVQYCKDHGVSKLGEKFFFITNPKSGTLLNIAKKLSATIIPHAAGISGRFSGLTNITTFIAMILGLDVEKYLAGAESVLDDFVTNEKSDSIIYASTIFALQKPSMINLGYIQQFSGFLEWYCQIIAESLGKNGNGITPIKGLGPNDQHSMLQLYIDGPKDKFYNFFYVKSLEKNFIINQEHKDTTLNKTYLTDINDITFKATRSALEEIKRPIRSVILNDLSEYSIGQLTSLSMLEVIILGKMMKIDPFNQPGVELIKNQIKQQLIAI
ncbi:MAG: hypothetical protein DGJ47_000961, partial [Rickettsiaceae bacterium]